MSATFRVMTVFMESGTQYDLNIPTEKPTHSAIVKSLREWQGVNTVFGAVVQVTYHAAQFTFPYYYVTMRTNSWQRSPDFEDQDQATMYAQLMWNSHDAR